MDGTYGPGVDWQAAHLANLAGLVLFVFLVFGIRRLLTPGPGRDTVTTVALVGAAASIVQFVADIVEGLLAADKAEMRELSHQFHALPGVDLAFYQVGPHLLYVGMIALTAMLAHERKLPWWSVAVVLVSSLLPLVTPDLIPLSAAGYLVALIPLWRRLQRPVSAHVGVTTRDTWGWSSAERSRLADEGVSRCLDQLVHGRAVHRVRLEEQPADADFGVPSSGLHGDRAGRGDRDLEVAECRRTLMSLGCLAKRGERARGLVEAQLPAIPTVSLLDGAAERGRRVTGDHDRRMWSLDRLWALEHIGERDVAPVERRRLVAPQGEHCREVFVGSRPSLRERHAERAQLGFQIAGSDSDDQPTP
jgi:hypothetical protein